MQDFSIDQIELQKRLAESNARREAEALARKEQSRADRKVGRLTEGVVNGLRACTIPQLIRAKKLCNEFIWDQRHAPPKADCRLQSQSCGQSLSAISVISLKLFAILRRAAKTYINGPYWYRYWRDGKVVFRKAVGKKNSKQLPRKVKSKLKEYSSNHDVARILEEIREKRLPMQQ